MPWKMETVMSQRKVFVTLAQATGVNRSELCRRFGISRKTGYKWRRHYREDGAQSQHDRSPRPPRSPRRTSPAIEQRVVALRQQHPPKGSHVRARMLADRGDGDGPATSTSTAIRRRHGLIAPAASTKRTPYQRCRSLSTMLTTRSALSTAADGSPSGAGPTGSARPSGASGSPCAPPPPTEPGASSSPCSRLRPSI